MPGWGMNVTGVSDLTGKFSKLAKTLSPPQTAEVALAGAEVIAATAKGNVIAQGLVDSGDLQNAIQPYKINQYSAGVKVASAYGATHEFGLTHQVATMKQIRFFWARFMATKNDMWRALALKGWYTIPARPYLRPAVDSSKGKALDAMKLKVVQLVRQATR